MDNECKVISEFYCYGERMVTVRFLKNGGFYAYKEAKYFFGKKNVYRTCI